MAEGPPYKSAADVPRGRPTPTQDELNDIALGKHPEISPDGTPEDPNVLQHDPRGTREETQRRTQPVVARPAAAAPKV
jgi:hypothetical protein